MGRMGSPESKMAWLALDPLKQQTSGNPTFSDMSISLKEPWIARART
jgi:hypothetical protein